MMTRYFHMYMGLLTAIKQLKEFLNENNAIKPIRQFKKECREYLKAVGSPCQFLAIPELNYYRSKLHEHVKSCKTEDQIRSALWTTLDAMLNFADAKLRSTYFYDIKENGYKYYYNSRFNFGKEVYEKLAITITDLDEAGKCLALDRCTACVFHLMRAMEISLPLLTQKLNADPVAGNKNWGDYMNSIKSAITKLPKPERERYSQVFNYLDAVRITWRNTTMHPKQTYTAEEATDIYNAVRIFMKDLARHL